MVFSLAGVANVVRASVSTAPMPVRGAGTAKAGSGREVLPSDPAELAPLWSMICWLARRASEE